MYIWFKSANSQWPQAHIISDASLLGSRFERWAATATIDSVIDVSEFSSSKNAQLFEVRCIDDKAASKFEKLLDELHVLESERLETQERIRSQEDTLASLEQRIDSVKHKVGAIQMPKVPHNLPPRDVIYKILMAKSRQICAGKAKDYWED